MLPARVDQLARRALRTGRRHVRARVQVGRGPADPAYARVTTQGVPVTARVDPGLRLPAHADAVRDRVAAALDAVGLRWWWVPRAEGRTAVVGVLEADRAGVTAALRTVTGPAWYVEALDELGRQTGLWERAGVPAGPAPGLQVWEFAVPVPGSRFLADRESGVELWFFETQGDDVVCLVKSSAVSRLPTVQVREPGVVPRALAARPTATVDFDVDVVYTWVDGNDDAWLRRKAAALGVADPGRFTERAHDEARFADHDELRFSLRALEQFAPWVRHVWVVTDGQHPSWLAREHPWVSVVDHRDVWPTADGLPSFNSHAIESCLHRVPGLAEHFLYLNDDMVLGRPVRAEQFFHANGIGKFFWSNAVVDHGASVTGDVASTTAARNARRLLEESLGVTFTRKFFHTAAALTVSGMTELEASFPEVVAATRRAQFRTLDDVALAGSFYLNWAYATGRAVPGRVRYTYIDPAAPDARARLRTLERTRVFDAFCVNDGSSEETPEQRRATDRLIRDFFGEYLPVPGTFEV